MGKFRILVAEDEAIVAMDLRQKLVKLGYCVPKVIRSGEEAIESAVSLDPDLLLMDIGLAGQMDGIEAATAIRERLGINVIFLTANSDQSTANRAYATNPLAYLLKPVELEQLQSAVADAFPQSDQKAA